MHALVHAFLHALLHAFVASHIAMIKSLIKNNLREEEFMWSQFKRMVYDSWESTVAEYGAADHTVHRARKQGWVSAGVRHASYFSFSLGL